MHSLIANIRLDFNSPSLRRRIKTLNHELLIKALHAKHNQLTIIDATAGLGQDAFLLAAAGHKVTMIERSTLTAKLLADGMHRAEDYEELKPIIARLNLIEADSITYLTSLKELPDIIYLDPMFKKPKNKALPRKEMQVLQVLVKSQVTDSSIDKLFEIARKKARLRLIVKRSRLEPPLSSDKPNFSLLGKTIRFDIYTGNHGFKSA